MSSAAEREEGDLLDDDQAFDDDHQEDDYDIDGDDFEEGLPEEMYQDADGDGLPDFANEENMELNEIVKEKEAGLELLSAEMDENTERVSIMAGHLKNVDSELLHTQALCDAKKREIESEQHLRQLAERETGRIRNDTKRAQKQSDDVQNKLNSVNNDIFVCNEKMEQFKLRMNWNQEELDQWALAAKQKEEDNLALEKYRRADETKVKKLNVAIEKMSKQVQRAKKQLDDEITETRASQIELDKTAEEFKRIHAERSDMIRKWDECMQAMQKRDQEITRIGQQLAEARHGLDDREKELDQQKNFMTTENTNNKQVELDITSAERTIEKLRFSMSDMNSRVLEMEHEVDVVRNELQKAQQDLRQAKIDVQSNAELSVEREKAFETACQRLVDSEAKLGSAMDETASMEERMQTAELMHAEHETILKRMTRDETQLKEHMFKQSQNLFTLRKQEANYMAEMSGSQSSSRNLQSKIHELDQRSLKQQEMLYNIEFQIQQLERKVARAGGKRSHEETTELNKKIEQLQLILNENQQQHTLLTTQVKRIHDGLRQAKRDLASAQEQKAALHSKIGELDLQNESALREIKSLERAHTERIVKHDEKKLEQKKLRDNLNHEANEVYSLQNRKLQLELSGEEKMKEVRMHCALSQAQLKAEDQERSRASKELKGREAKVDKLKAKFETLAGKLRGSGEDNQERSQAYYIIQAAQEREELQRKGDQLNVDIKKAEKEMRLLNKTLKALNVRNQSYRESFRKSDGSGPESQQKAVLEQQYKAVSDSLYKKKSYMREISTDYEVRKRHLAELHQDIQMATQDVQRAQQEQEELQRDLAQQDEKLKRAQKSATKIQTQFRQHVGSDEHTPEEIDIELASARERNRAMLGCLAGLCAQFPDLEQHVAHVLAEQGVKFVARTGTAALSRQSTPSGRVSRPSSSASRRGPHRPDSSLSRQRPSSSRSDRSDVSRASRVSARVVNIGLG